MVVDISKSSIINEVKFHFLSEAGRPSEESARTSRVSPTFFAPPNGLAQKVEFRGNKDRRTTRMWSAPLELRSEATHLLQLVLGLLIEGRLLAVALRVRRELVVPRSSSFSACLMKYVFPKQD